MWLFWRIFQKLMTWNWMALETAKDRLDGVNTADELAGFDDLLHNWFILVLCYSKVCAWQLFHDCTASWRGWA
jgi:hypothetical protein